LRYGINFFPEKIEHFLEGLKFFESVSLIKKGSPIWQALII